MAQQKLTAVFDGDERGLKRATKSVRADVASVGKTAQKANDAVAGSTKGIDGLTTSVTGFATKAMTTYATIGATVGSTVAVVGAAIRAYSESEAVQLRLERAVKNSGATYAQHDAHLQKVIATHSELAAVDDELVSEALSKLIRDTKDLTAAQQLLPVVLNASRAEGKDLIQTATVIGKVYNGNVGALRRYGFAVKDGATVTEALGELQKRYAGYAEEYGDSVVGSADRITTAMGNLQESSGEVAVKVFKVDESLSGLSASMERMARKDKKAWATFIRDVSLGAGWLLVMSQRQGQAIKAEAQAATSKAQYIKVTYDARTALQRYTGAVKENRDALTAGQDAELDKLRADEAVEQAQKNLTETVKEYGSKSREAKIAQLELNQAKREAQRLAGEYNKNLQEIEDTQKRLAKQKEIQGYIRDLRDLWAGAGSKAASYQRTVNAIQHSGKGRNLTAGYAEYASGGKAVGPTEGYPVTLHGTEWVIPDKGDANSVNLLALAARSIGVKQSQPAQKVITINVSGSKNDALHNAVAMEAALMQVLD